MFKLTSGKLRIPQFGEMSERKLITQETHTCLDLIYMKVTFERFKRKKFYLQI